MGTPHSSPAWFLHRLDSAAGLGSYVRTTAAGLRGAAFIDGREQFWDAEEVRPLVLDGQMSARSSNPSSTAFSYLFHVSFCGSTLLGRILDQPGRSLVLREPQALADLAAQQSGLMAKDPGALAALCDLVIRETATLLAPGEAGVIKPSNWANSLIPALCDARTGANAVFLSMDCAQFVAAVFRGGRDRLAYTARAAAHLTSSTGLGAAAVQTVAAQGSDPLDQMACFAALSHRVQETIFRSAMAQRDWGDDHWFDFADITADPARAAHSAARALGLHIDRDAIERQASMFTGIHSKDKGLAFSRERRSRENDLVWHHHRDRINRAVEWAATIDL